MDLDRGRLIVKRDWPVVIERAVDKWLSLMGLQLQGAKQKEPRLGADIKLHIIE